MHGYPSRASGRAFPDSVQMHHYMMQQSQPEQYSYAPTGHEAHSNGDFKNHALEALSEALDRAEVDMLLGGRRRHQASPPAVDFSLRAAHMPRGGQAARGVNSSRQDFSSNSPTNYALQAAREALGKFDQPKPTRNRVNTLQLSPDPSADAMPSTRHAGGHHSEAPAELALNLGYDSAVNHRRDGGQNAGLHLVRPTSAGDQRQRRTFKSPESRQGSPNMGAEVLQTQAPESTVAFQQNFNDPLPIPEHIDFENFVSPSKLLEEYDEEMESIARREIDEDEVIDFSRRLPPKPPQIDIPRPPLLDGAIPPLNMPAPPKRKVPKKSRAETKDRQRLEKRDFLVDSILNDEVPSRSTTPRNIRARSQHHSTGPKLPEMRSRSMPHCEEGRSSQNSVSSKPVTPRHRQQVTMQFSHVDGIPKADTLHPLKSGKAEEQPEKPERHHVSLLPQLENLSKHERSQRALKASGSQSARTWRGKAAVNLYA